MGDFHLIVSSWVSATGPASHQVSKIKLIKEQSLNVIENAKKPATGLLFDTDRILNESRREKTKRKGLQFLGSLIESTEITGQNGEFTEPCEFYQLTIENITSGLESIQHENFFSDLDAVELESFMSEEDIIPTCEQPSAEQLMRVSVDHAIDENSPTMEEHDDEYHNSNVKSDSEENYRITLDLRAFLTTAIEM